jgi:hypothetical protein
VAESNRRLAREGVINEALMLELLAHLEEYRSGASLSDAPGE